MAREERRDFLFEDGNPGVVFVAARERYAGTTGEGIDEPLRSIGRRDMGACLGHRRARRNRRLRREPQHHRPGPAGLNVRASPAGAVIAALKAKDRWVEVHVTGQSGAWARIDLATFISEDHAEGTPVFKGVGWVAFSKLGINEIDQIATVYNAPSDGRAGAAEDLGGR